MRTRQIDPYVRLPDRFGCAELIVISDDGAPIAIPLPDHALLHLARGALEALGDRLPPREEQENPIMPDPIIHTAADLDITTRTIWGEARGEGADGWVAVAWVIRNRAGRPSWWGRTPATVCQAPEQFSCWNQSDPNRAKLIALAPDAPMVAEISAMVAGVFAGTIADPTGGADHYEVVGTGAAWARGRLPSATIGHHAFYALGPGA